MDTPLRIFRRSRKETLEALAAKLGITAGQLSRIERGKSTSLETAMAIKRLTGVNVGPLADVSDRDFRAVERALGGKAA